MSESIGKFVDIDDLKEWDENPRVNDHAVKDVAASIKRFGFASPIIARKENGEIIAGHTRYKAAKELGLDRVPVRYVDLDPVDSKLLAIADNKIAEKAEWENDSLGRILRNLDEQGIDISVTGFSEDDLDNLFPPEPAQGLTDPDEIPEAPKEPTVQRGEIWQLGEHRLMCGDSTIDDDVAMLMDGDRADLCLTDPPYGLGGKKASGKNEYDIHNDTQENLIKLIDGWLPIARSMCSAVVFSPGVTNLWLYPQAEWVMSWFYGGGQLRSSWGFNCWQPFLCYGKDPSLATGHGGRPDAVDMNTPANAGDINHPCPKPVKLWVWFIDRMSFASSDLFYEPFCGSGTTLIACEQTNRKCYGMEISPNYCDVIIKRWEDFTGKKAELIKTAT